MKLLALVLPKTRAERTIARFYYGRLIPLQHPNCRCSVIALSETRVAQARQPTHTIRVKWQRDTTKGRERVTEWLICYSDGTTESVTKRERVA